MARSQTQKKPTPKNAIQSSLKEAIALLNGDLQPRPHALFRQPEASENACAPHPTPTELSPVKHQGKYALFGESLDRNATEDCQPELIKISL